MYLLLLACFVTYTNLSYSNFPKMCYFCLLVSSCCFFTLLEHKFN